MKQKWIQLVSCLAILICLMTVQGWASEPVTSYSIVKQKTNVITVKTGKQTRRYTRYAEINNTGYLQRQGCVHTAVSIAASAFGKNYAPIAIYMAKPAAAYGEKHAVKQIKAENLNTTLAGRSAITVSLAGKILENMGIPVSVQYKVPYKQTVRKIRAHLAKGLPVIVKCKDNIYKSTRFTTAHHAIVLVGIDKADHVQFIDSWTAKLNTPAISCNNAKLTVEELVKKFMYSASSDAAQPYVGNLAAGGGYILVG